MVDETCKLEHRAAQTEVIGLDDGLGKAFPKRNDHVCTVIGKFESHDIARRSAESPNEDSAKAKAAVAGMLTVEGNPAGQLRGKA
jgi:hypothetical protein